MNRRWTVFGLAALAAMVVAPILLLLVVRPVEAPGGSPPASPGASVAASETATPSGRGITFTMATSPDDAAWYRIGRDPRAFPQHLEIGTTGEGATHDVVIDWAFAAAPGSIVPTRPIAGIVDGVVVIVDDDARTSTLSAVVASTGAAHDLVAVDDVIVAAAVLARSREVVYITADRRTGELTAAWLVSLEEPDPPRPLAGLLPAIGDVPRPIRLVAVAQFATWLMVSPDGSTVALFRCVQLDCVLRAVGTEDGRLIGEHPIDRGLREPFAVSNRLAFLSPVVPDGPERFGEALDLETGVSARLPVEPWPSLPSHAIGTDAGGDFLAIQTAGHNLPPALMGQPLGEPPTVAIVDLPGFDRRADLTLPLASLRILPASDWTIGVDLPAGWVLAEVSLPGETPMTFVAIDLSDGSVVPLPALGELLLQG